MFLHVALAVFPIIECGQRSMVTLLFVVLMHISFLYLPQGKGKQPTYWLNGCKQPPVEPTAAPASATAETAN